MSENLTPLRAIKKYCRQCSGESPSEVKLCPITDCPLYSYRFGSNPKRHGIGGIFRPKQALVPSDLSTERIQA